MNNAMQAKGGFTDVTDDAGGVVRLVIVGIVVVDLVIVGLVVAGHDG